MRSENVKSDLDRFPYSELLQLRRYAIKKLNVWFHFDNTVKRKKIIRKLYEVPNENGTGNE